MINRIFFCVTLIGVAAVTSVNVHSILAVPQVAASIARRTDLRWFGNLRRLSRFHLREVGEDQNGECRD